MPKTIEFNPLSNEHTTNPYPLYDELRDHAPIIVDSLMGFYMVSRYDDVREVIKNTKVFSSRAMGPELIASTLPGISEDPRFLTQNIAGCVPPEHTRLRRLVSAVFTSRRIAKFEEEVRVVTNQLLDEAETSGRFDFIEDLAGPLPVVVISKMLGLDPARWRDLKRWSDDVIEGTAGDPFNMDVDRIQASMQAQFNYFRSVIDERQAEAKDDLISELLRAHSEDDKLTLDEVQAFATLLLIAGNETTTNMMGNAMLSLLRHPDQLDALRNDPSLIPAAMEEALRYDTPFKSVMRLTLEDTTLGGVSIAEGSIVMLLLGSANRDPRHFPEPDIFDIRRGSKEHFAFGYGLHYCIGANLARLETRVAFECLLERFGAIRQASKELTYKPSLVLRALEALPLECR